MSQLTWTGFALFAIISFSIFSGLHYWVYRTLRNSLQKTKFNKTWVRRTIATLFIVFDLPWLYFYLYRFTTYEADPAYVWFVRHIFAFWQTVLLFWIIVLLVYTPVKKLMQLLKYAAKKFFKERIPAIPVEDKSRRRFIRLGSLGLSAYALGTTAGSVIDSDDYESNVKHIIIPNLPDAFKGFSIGFISDIHSGIYQDRAFMEKYAKLVNNLKCDMIVLPGDFINSLDREIYPFAEVFSSLHAPAGVFGCTGNHDYFANADLICKESEQAGIKMLRNENIAIERNGQKIYLLGIDDIHVGKHEPQKYVETGKSEYIEAMLKGVPDDSTKILLCHRPYPFEEFAQCNMDLMLSGHTHGGQVVFANFGNWNASFASLISKYIQGHYRSEKNPRSQMYVSRGIGTVGVPIRVNCPPEVTKIVLG
jgi:predicted MPP superfamily phosphohydrolase